MIRINLDKTLLNIIFENILINKNEIFIFYNDLNGEDLNKEKIFKLIFFIEKKLSFSINYYFYNIPFCLFKKLGRNFIDNHCIRNRLCNYYEGYVTYDKCNRCRYGLFCNNFNEKINKNQIKQIEGFYEGSLIKKEFLLKKLVEIKKYFLNIGYKEEEITFYITQKYIWDFLFGKIEYLTIDVLQYLIVYILVNNNLVSETIFEDIDSGIMVFKEKNNFTLFVKEIGFSINIVNDKVINRVILNFRGNCINLDRYYSIEKYISKKSFFDFTEYDLLKEGKVDIFRGIVYNRKSFVIKTNFNVIRNANDLINSKIGNIYIGKDILGGFNINDYKGILLTNDNLGTKGRFISSLGSIKIPVIYDIKPNILNVLKYGDKIEIDFYNGIIKRI